MLRSKPFIFLACLALQYPVVALAALPALSVHISNALPATGKVEVTLFNSADSFMREAYLQQSGEISESGEFTANFAGLEEGEYAVVVVHDENGNETYDNGFLGIGAEGIGYSNNVRPWFFRPDFDDLKFSVDTESTKIEIRID
jgi:uncharacterized protein (DUF2141 family)